MASDDEKTVFGQPLPPRPGAGAGAGAGSGGGSGEKTVFGQPLPPAQGGPAGPGRVAPVAPQPWNTPGPDDTWLGGALPPQGAPAPHHPGYPPLPQHPPAGHWPQPAAPLYQPGTGQRPAGSEIFPEIPQDRAPVQPMAGPRIALADALKGATLGAGGSSNPLIAAAANLMILLGRLRTGLVDMQAGPLIDHVTREIDRYERAVLEAGVSPQDASDAKYVLSATADDIVQNLPGTDRGLWIQYSMVARFFGDRSSGVGFFQKMDEAMRAPGQRFNLLELMLTCLSLGFEGQYRALPNGGVELARIRTAIYETLRRVHPRPDDDIAVHWAAVPMQGKRRRGGTPLWVVAAVAALMLVTLFATLSTLLTRQGATVRDGILALHAGLPPITIERTEPITQAYVAPDTGQMERIRAGLAAEIEAGQIEVDRTNDWIFVRVGEFLHFASGRADLTSDFAPLAAAIGKTLDAEPGGIRVVGHTDSIPVSGRGRYKTNQDLSEARAQTVAEILKGFLADPARVAAEGKGSVDPIADNATPDGRARNRRVEIMIPREE